MNTDKGNFDKPILSVSNLKVCFETVKGSVTAVGGVSFDLMRNQILGVVGESGCGKTVMTRAVMGLLSTPPAVITASKIEFEKPNGDVVDLKDLSNKGFQSIRGKEISMIFQEPMTSLNPLFTIGNQLTEHVLVHEKIFRQEANKRALELLRQVGIPSPELRMSDYPHQLSGGMRQRIMIAMAMICKPSLLIADEPTTALDVTIQAQILKLLKSIQAREQTSIIFISHDLAVISMIADVVIVMYQGRIVEQGTPRQVFQNPQHPYTIGLINSLPRMDQPRKTGLKPIKGSMPDPYDPPKGCGFHPRCPHITNQCQSAVPELEHTGEGRRVACWHLRPVRIEI